MAQLIDGKAISQQIKDELKAEVEALKNDGTDICLAVIQVGDDPASSVYVRNKKRACAYIGVESRAYELPEDTTEEQLVELVKELNADDTVNGILVQLHFLLRLMKIRSSGRFRLIRTWMDSILKVWEDCGSGKRDFYPALRPV